MNEVKQDQRQSIDIAMLKEMLGERDIQIELARREIARLTAHLESLKRTNK